MSPSRHLVSPASRALLWVLGALALAACTVENPYYGTQSNPVDLGTSDSAPPLTCDVTGRMCVGNNAGTCQSRHPILDRWCPSDSLCENGVCQPPEGNGNVSGRPCTYDGDCADADPYTCQPFLVDGNLSFLCAQPVGNGSPVTPCVTGQECLSGICTSRGTCFKRCMSDADCPAISGRTQTCEAVGLSVDGRSTNAKSCVLPRMP